MGGLGKMKKSGLRYIGLHLGERSILRSCFKGMKNPPVQFPYSTEFSLKGNVFIGDNGRGKSVLLKHLACAPNNGPFKSPRGSQKPIPGFNLLSEPDDKEDIKDRSENVYVRVLMVEKRDFLDFLSEDRRYVKFSIPYYDHTVEKDKFDVVTVNRGLKRVLERHSEVSCSGKALSIDSSERRPAVNFLDMARDLSKVDVSNFLDQDGDGWCIRDVNDLWTGPYSRKRLHDDLMSCFLFSTLSGDCSETLER